MGEGEALTEPIDIRAASLLLANMLESWVEAQPSTLPEAAHEAQITPRHREKPAYIYLR